MMNGRRSSVVGGLLLILLGLLFLVLRLVPAVRLLISWPLVIIGVGLILLVMAVVARTPGLAVPASIVGGMGGLLYWQNLTGRWGTWTWAWTLIPGFVGFGVLLTGLLGENPRENIRGGGTLLIISTALFLVFGSFLGGLRVLGPYWPVLLIGLGLLLLIGQLAFRRRG